MSAAIALATAAASAGTQQATFSPADPSAAPSESGGTRSRALAARRCGTPVLVCLPYSLGFSSGRGGLRDRNGVGTGFTWIARAGNRGTYVRRNVVVDRRRGKLRIRTTAGLAHESSNSQDNALAVGIKAKSQITITSATLVNTPRGTGRFEQAGIWFGINQDHYVKLVVLSRPGRFTIQHLKEVGGAEQGRVESSAFRVRGARVNLTLRANPFNTSVAATYRVGSGPRRALGSFKVPSAFFSADAAGINPRIGTRSFSGILASHRMARRPLVYSFDSFSVRRVRSAPTTPPTGGGSIRFSRSSFGVTSPFLGPTSIARGPDGRLYVTELFGTIHAYRLNAAKRVVGHQVIRTLGRRLALGIAIDPRSTRRNMILWVAHSSPTLNNGVANSSTVTRLSGRGFRRKRHVITGLPRAVANHAINSIHFRRGILYIAMGGNTGAGAPNRSQGALNEFGTRPEQPLSAALLVANVRARRFDGSCAVRPGSYRIPCSVRPYATGLRNMYDFVFHSNGFVYGADNGASVTPTFPPKPTAPCTGFGDPKPWNQGGDNPGEQTDPLFRLVRGGYHGHPNPYRRQCVFEDGDYQNTSPLRNYVAPIHDLGRKKSYNGIIEYRSRVFRGALRGDLLLTSFAQGQHILRVELSRNGRDVVRTSELVGNLDDPLPLAQGPDGTIYVGEFGAGRVTVLRPAR